MTIDKLRPYMQPIAHQIMDAYTDAHSLTDVSDPFRCGHFASDVARILHDFQTLHLEDTP